MDSVNSYQAKTKNEATKMFQQTHSIPIHMHDKRVFTNPTQTVSNYKQ